MCAERSRFKIAHAGFLLCAVCVCTNAGMRERESVCWYANRLFFSVCVCLCVQLPNAVQHACARTHLRIRYGGIYLRFDGNCVCFMVGGHTQLHTLLLEVVGLEFGVVEERERERVRVVWSGTFARTRV